MIFGLKLCKLSVYSIGNFFLLLIHNIRPAARFGTASVFITATVLALYLAGSPVSAGPPSDIVLDFDGAGSHVLTQVHAGELGLAGNSPRTFEAWVYRLDYRRGGVFTLGSHTSAGSDFGLRARGAADEWHVQVWGNDLIFEYPSENRWVHLAIVHTGDTMIAYADGSEIARAGAILNTTTDRSFGIGLFKWPHRENQEIFNGRISEVRLWNRALDDEEIRANMSRTLSGDEEGLTGYWPLSDGTGSTAADLAGGNDGRLAGGARWTPANPFVRDLESFIEELTPGQSVTFGPVELAEPRGDVAYQWYFNGEPLEEADQSSLTIPRITSDDLGRYHVVIDDESELTPVRSGYVRLPEWPVWREDVQDDLTVRLGDTVTLGPVELYSPEGEVEYQWYLDGEPVDGATGSSLNIPLIEREHLGAYHVVADDDQSLTPAQSSSVQLLWPVWTTNISRGKDAVPGQTVELGPVALHDPAGEVKYQWFFNDESIECATDSELVLHDITNEQFGNYYVIVDDDRERTPVRSESLRITKPDWPMWRFDAQRSADSPHRLAGELHLQWVRELPSPRRAWPFQRDDRGKLDFDISYAPVVMGERIFVPSSATDSVTAYSIEDGRELWRFYADGPVRLAPAAWRDRIFFTSDDGHLYSVAAESGELIWKFRAGPSDHRLLGNERIINFWAARGAPVVRDDTVYFAAGIWPLHGIFIYALDAGSGDVVWVNDETGSDYVRLPHGGAYGYGGLAPQGYLAASEDRLIVAGGRGLPAYLNRDDGSLARGDFRAKPGGGYAVHGLGGGGIGMQRSDMLAERVDELGESLGGEVFYKLAARDRLFVSTKEGKLYCFGPERVQPGRYEYRPEALRPSTQQWGERAASLLEELGEREGYALVLGAGSGDLARELLMRSDLHVVVVEEDAQRVRELREELSAAGMYGGRAAVIEADPAAFSVQPYLFSLVVSEDAGEAGLASGDADTGKMLNLLRPYGGVAWLGAAGEALRQSAADAGVDRVSVEADGEALFARRGGPLTGAGEWTHQYHDPANTLVSRDDLVRLPLGVLWFGGPSNHNILPRHSGGPRPQVAGGRQIFLGVETIGARCVYTGRQLWEREFPGIGHPFTNMGLERRWRDGSEVYMSNVPGATYIGSPYVTLPDSIYLRYEGRVYRLDAATGETVDEFAVPGRPVSEIYGDEAPDWGHLSVQGDYLVTTGEPHLFEGQSLGWEDSYSGTSSRRLSVLDRRSGEVLWEREASIGYRHGAIISSGETLFVIDGVSENVRSRLARRGRLPDEPSRIIAIDLGSGEERWSSGSDVFGTYLAYSAEHDVLIEGGSRDMRFREDWVQFEDEPRAIAARRGADGTMLWEGGSFLLPGAVRGEMLIPGRPGTAISLLTGEEWQRRSPLTGESRDWSYTRTYGCNTLNASKHMLFYRSGYAGYFDLEHDSGTGNFAGFRSGCTPNLIPADGVLNALDYTRTCTCSYAHQTSLALIHMPDDPGIEFWTRYDGSRPDPAGHGINFGAPGRRVDVAGEGLVWHDEDGTSRRHPSAIRESGDSIAWVAASVREGEESIIINDLIDTTYTVRLHFAELDESVKPGMRVFDVYAQSGQESGRRFMGLVGPASGRQRLLRRFDIVKEAGAAMRGIVREFSVDVAGGSIEIEFSRARNSVLDPVISGIELMSSEF